MKIASNLQLLLFSLLILVTILIFFLPELIIIYKTKKRINELNLEIDNFKIKKVEFRQKLEDSKNVSEILQKAKDEEANKLKELIKTNSFYGEAIEEEKSDSYLIERRNYNMKALLNLYEKNNETTQNIIKNLHNFFQIQNHTLNDYYNNISNILITSSIIRNESDINFIYDKIIRPLYSNSNNSRYILGSPCFKVSIDSNEPFIFHKKCNEAEDTIMLIKTNKTRFGGITDLSWTTIYTKNKDYNKTKTRLFNLDNQKIFLYNKNFNANLYISPIRSENYYFAIFGYNDIYLGYLPWESSSSFPQMFLKDNNTDKRFNDLLNEYIHPFYDEINFEYEDIEVYPIILINKTQE